MTTIFNALAQVIIIIGLVFTALALAILTWYYFKVFVSMVKKPKPIKYDTRPIIEQLDEAIGGKKNGNKR